MNIQQNLSLMEKLAILTDAAKYDVACTSSGADRRGDGRHMGNCLAPGVCHAFAADGRCISLLKILFTNESVRLNIIANLRVVNVSTGSTRLLYPG